MRKLALEIDALRVESFATGGERGADGTVRGHRLEAATDDKTPFVTETIPHTYCGDSCDCGGTQDDTCRSCAGNHTCGSCLPEFCDGAVEAAFAAVLR